MAVERCDAFRQNRVVPSFISLCGLVNADFRKSCLSCHCLCNVPIGTPRVTKADWVTMFHATTRNPMEYLTGLVSRKPLERLLYRSIYHAEAVPNQVM